MERTNNWSLLCIHWRASERVTRSFENIPLVSLVTRKAVHSGFRSICFSPTWSSQLNHFSLTCSFVHLPKCKISSKQRSKNVNNKKIIVSITDCFTQRQMLIQNVDNNKNQRTIMVHIECMPLHSIHLNLNSNAQLWWSGGNFISSTHSSVNYI